MKIIKKILRIIAIILPVFCCCFVSSGSSYAKEYTIDRIPAVNVHVGSRASLYDSLEIDFGNNPVPSGFSPIKQTAIYSTWDSSLNKCKFDSKAESVHYDSPRYSLGVSLFYDKYYSDIPDSRCNNIQSTPFNDYDFHSLSVWDIASLVNNDRLYPFEYRYFNAHDTQVVEGKRYSNYLKASDLFGTKIGKFKSLSIPFELDSDLIGNYSKDRIIEFKGSFNFPACSLIDDLDQSHCSPGWLPFEWNQEELHSTLSFRLYYNYFVDSNGRPGNRFSSYVDCNVVKLNYSDGVNLSYSCPFTLPDDSWQSRAYGFNLVLNSVNYFWDTGADWSFNALYVITDNDSTPGGSAVSPQIGAKPDSAPGSALLPDSKLDFFQSILDLVRIEWLNPFAPIFSTFAGPGCYDFPVLHDFAHFPEHMCTIYPREVLDITTPVFSMIGTILLFSVGIRWLRGDDITFISNNNYPGGA